MALSHWRKRAEKARLDNPWWSYRCDEVELPSGRHGEYHYVHTHGSVMIIPLDGYGRVLLTEQYRYLNDRTSLEFPGGGMEENVAPYDMAMQELAEEAGYTTAELIPIGSFNPYNGVTDEICHVFVAMGLSPVESNPDETEEFRVHWLVESEMPSLIRNGDIWDGMSLASWNLYQHWITRE